MEGISKHILGLSIKISRSWSRIYQKTLCSYSVTKQVKTISCVPDVRHFVFIRNVSFTSRHLFVKHNEINKDNKGKYTHFGYKQVKEEEKLGKGIFTRLKPHALLFFFFIKIKIIPRLFFDL